MKNFFRSFRLANEEDKNWVASVISADEHALQKLNIFGSAFSSVISLNDNYSFTMIAEADGKQVGFITVDYKPLGNENYLSAMFIKKEYRNMGIGSQLLEKALNKIKKEYSPRKIYAITIENKKMDSFLKKFGFKKNGHIKDFCFRNGKYYDQNFLSLEY